MSSNSCIICISPTITPGISRGICENNADRKCPILASKIHGNIQHPALQHLVALATEQWTGSAWLYYSGQWRTQCHRIEMQLCAISALRATAVIRPADVFISQPLEHVPLKSVHRSKIICKLSIEQYRIVAWESSNMGIYFPQKAWKYSEVQAWGKTQYHPWHILL